MVTCGKNWGPDSTPHSRLLTLTASMQQGCAPPNLGWLKLFCVWPHSGMHEAWGKAEGHVGDLGTDHATHCSIIGVTEGNDQSLESVLGTVSTCSWASCRRASLLICTHPSQACCRCSGDQGPQTHAFSFKEPPSQEKIFILL